MASPVSLVRMQLGEHACCGTAYTRRLSAARCHSRGEHHRQPHIMQVVRAGCHTFGSVPSQSKMRKAESRPRACSRAVCLQPPLYFCILCFIGKHGGGGFDGFRVIRSPLHAAPAKGKREWPRTPQDQRRSRAPPAPAPITSFLFC